MLEPAADAEVLADGTPARLGRYRLVRPISTGGMARVFEARRESLAGVSPRVAIKVILPDFAQHDGFQRLFINEARIGSLLTHQNLVQIQDFDSQDDRYYLVMEFVDGLTLRRVVALCRRHGVPVPLHVVAEIGRQVCDGLGYAHAATSDDGAPLHLVHRDIKPSNLMLNPQGVVKLLDFGISKALVTAERKGAVRGTWGYMAPEQAAGGEVSAQADLYGLAAVLYELAVLQPLFPEKEPERIRALMEADEAARRATALTGPMAPLSSVLVRALQRDPAARFVSAAAMGRALGTLISDPVTARDRLVRFQQEMEARAAEGLAEARRQGVSSTMSPTGTSQSTGASLGAPGLPVAVGDQRGPRPVVDLRPAPGPPPPTPSAWRRALPVALTLLAVGVVAFTAWRLLEERAEPAAPPAQAAPGPLSRLAEEAPAPPSSAPAPPSSAPAPPSSAPSPPSSAPSPTPPTPSPTPPAPAPPSSAPAATSPTPAATSPAPAATSPAPAATSPAPAAAVPVTAPAADGADGPPAAAAGGAPVAGEVAVTISSDPRATVVIDKVPRGQTPLMGLSLPAGRHAVTLETADGRRSTFTIDVDAERKNTWVYDFESRSFR